MNLKELLLHEVYVGLYYGYKYVIKFDIFHLFYMLSEVTIGRGKSDLGYLYFL